MIRHLLTLFAAVHYASAAPDPSAQHPRRNGPGPWDNDVLVHKISNDGVVQQLARFERAGVPTAARMKDGRLIVAHQFFSEKDDSNFDKVAVRFSSDEGHSWTVPTVIQMKGLPEDMRSPFDPTLVSLPDGSVRLYFTSVKRRPIERQPPAIYSGISTNGIAYAFEPGVRFAIEGRIVIDCAVALHNGTFHLYAPDNGPARIRPRGAEEGSPAEPPAGIGYHAVSQDGLVFQRTNDVHIAPPRRWLGNAQSQGETIKFYGTGGRGGIWIGSSKDGANWNLAEQPARIPGADPGTVTLRDGSLLFVATGGPRPGTPSANRRPRPKQAD